MKSLSLLAKQLLVTATVSAVAVSITAIGLQYGYQAAREELMSAARRAAERQASDEVQRLASRSTHQLADRLVELISAGRIAEVNSLLGHALDLDGAQLIVVFDQTGNAKQLAGDRSALADLSRAPVGVPAVSTTRISLRVPIGEPKQRLGTVGQLFPVQAAASSSVTSVLDAVLHQYNRRSLIRAGALSLLGTVAAVLLLTAFVTPQVRALRALTRSVQRLGRGRFDTPVEISRGDELGELADAFERTRAQLRDTTISRDYLDKVLDSMSEGLFLVGPDACIVRVNTAASRMMETGAEDLKGKPLSELIDPAQREQFRIADSAGRSLETALTVAGQTIPISYTFSEIQDPNPAFRGFIFAARNITDRKIAEQRIRYLARIDALTKVPNRMQFQHLLQRAIARAHRSATQLALLYLDVDNFKEINDTFGHTAGDVCLETLTARLTSLLAEGTVVGRFAGDEFGIILDRIDEHEDIGSYLSLVACRILREISQVVHVQSHQIHMTASIGIAIFPKDAQSVIDLIRNADAALYQAKRSGGDSLELYDPQMHAAATERLMLKSRLRRAYERNELLMHYQPKFDIRSGQVAGAEALVRWEMSERGLVLPSEFIPLAEESNLILDIGAWVLDRVCEDYRTWQDQMLFPGRVAVNLSLKQLRQPNFSRRVLDSFHKHGVPPASLELEITETTLMENPERTVNILRELYSMGLSLAIDDFGTGYSSLSALQKFPITTLKIDKSFVRNVATDPDDATIVSTIIEMGHSLNMDVIAEGVEREEQLRFLKSTNCDFVQGHLFGDPMSAAQFMQLLLRQRNGSYAYASLFG